jgi:hypothetical protein
MPLLPGARRGALAASGFDGISALMTTPHNTLAAALEGEDGSGLAPVRSRMEKLLAARSSIGGLPPIPPTLRGWIGSLLVALVRRSLFWLLPQLDEYHNATIEVLSAQGQALEDISVQQQRLLACALEARDAAERAADRIRGEALEYRKLLVELRRLTNQIHSRTEALNQAAHMCHPAETQVAESLFDGQATLATSARNEAAVWFESLRCRAESQENCSMSSPEGSN